MSIENATLVTIYTESVLESKLIRDFEQLGATGYTIMNARGRGSRGVRSGAWEANSNIRIEILCGEQLAKELMAHLRDTYYDNYAMVMYRSGVEVLRPSKFRRP